MNRKILSATIALLFTGMTWAQTEYDALKVAQYDINGTARYVSMGGAFGALGGDPSAIKDNPAGLGIYRKSEINGTMGLSLQGASATWNNGNGSNDSYKLGFNNFSYVMAFPTWRSEKNNSGIQSSNFSFAYNRLKNFNRQVTVNGGALGTSMTDYMAYFTNGITSYDLTYERNVYDPFDNTNIPWISVLAYEGYLMNEIGENSGSWESFLDFGETVTPKYVMRESGFIDEFSFTWSGNFSNRVFIGASLNLQSIDYRLNSDYTELFEEGGNMILSNNMATTGSGINFKIGAIIIPTDMVRLGLSVHTPTIYRLNDYFYGDLNSDTGTSNSISTPDGYSNYNLQTPFQVNASAALILDNGLISAEYVYNTYSTTRLMDRKNNTNIFSDENEGMRSIVNDLGTLKLGGEYKVDNNFSIRAGYAFSGSLVTDEARKLLQPNTMRTDLEFFNQKSIAYYSLGFGYRETNWYFDAAFQQRVLNEDFYPFNSTAITPASLTSTNNNFIATLGFRF